MLKKLISPLLVSLFLFTSVGATAHCVPIGEGGGGGEICCSSSGGVIHCQEK